MKLLILAVITAFTFVACTKPSLPTNPQIADHVTVSLKSWLAAGATVTTEYYFATSVEMYPVKLRQQTADEYNSIPANGNVPAVLLYVPKADYDEYF